MKRFMTLAMATLLVSAPSAAFSQDKPAAAPAAGAAAAAPAGAAKEKFYNFDDLLIDGEYKKPNALLFTGRDKVKFDRLLKLRKSFIPVILTSDKERALR